MNLPDFIVTDALVCGGQPVFRGTRVTLRSVLASLAAGDDVADILHAFPSLTADHIRAAVAFAAGAASRGEAR